MGQCWDANATTWPVHNRAGTKRESWLTSPGWIARTPAARRRGAARVRYDDRGVLPQERWLFPGRRRGQPLSTRQLTRLFHEATAAAGIRKDVTLHALRHSFATHRWLVGTYEQVENIVAVAPWVPWSWPPPKAVPRKPRGWSSARAPFLRTSPFVPFDKASAAGGVQHSFRVP
jgi:hypothetical protein